MKNYTFYTYRAAEGLDGSKDIEQLFQAGDLTIYCKLMFDMDDISDTYGHWIAVMDVVSDDIDTPERSLVLNPNTVAFIDDDLYTVAVVTDLDSISYNDLDNVYISIGVPSDE